MVRVYIIVFLFLFTGNVFAQNASSTKNKKRPKIGLVLSGGGAKGFAHIGAIQLLEECGIKPDYITGTSMGSIVGGLYAMGYTVNEMKQISDTTNWDLVLSNTVPLTEVTMVEKPYYGTFLLDMDVSKKGVALPGGLIEGQNLQEKLSVLSRPVHGITSFLDFPIPFKCIATDIVRGLPVALDHGNITEAIRASMAIPTAFTPVKYDTFLLIDGGWTRNLPVQEVKDMGADIIISVNVGAPLKTEDELGSMVSILDQTAWMLSVKDTEKQIEMSDFLISPPVSSFSTFDFAKANEIIQVGYEEATKQRSEFEALAKRIYPTGKFEGEIKKPFDKPTYSISNIVVVGNKLTSKKFVAGRLSIKQKQSYTAEQINEKIGRLYGTLYYEKINFELVPKDDGTQELQVYVIENNPAKLKVSLYYDTENSIGLNLNVTLRNLAFRNSRLIIDAFVSENPIVGMKYIKYIGQRQNGFLFTDAKYTKDSRFQWLNISNQPTGYNYREVALNAGVAYTIKNKLLLGGQIGFRGARLSPVTNPDTVVSRLGQVSTPLGFFAQINTFDNAVFPTSGTKLILLAEMNLDVNHRVYAKEGAEDWQPTLDEVFKVDPFASFRLGIQQFVPIHKKVSLYADAEIKFNSQKNIGFNDYSKVGGIAPILYSAVPYWGAQRDELVVRQFASASLGLQWNFYSDLYFKAKVDYINTEYPMLWFIKDQPKETFDLYGQAGLTSMFGFGGELAYNSAIGPIRLVLHQNQYSNSLNFFVAVGFNIYKSFGDF